jgi:hypothetical protein
LCASGARGLQDGNARPGFGTRLAGSCRRSRGRRRCARRIASDRRGSFGFWRVSLGFHAESRCCAQRRVRLAVDHRHHSRRAKESVPLGCDVSDDGPALMVLCRPRRRTRPPRPSPSGARSIPGPSVSAGCRKSRFRPFYTKVLTAGFESGQPLSRRTGTSATGGEAYFALETE